MVYQTVLLLISMSTLWAVAPSELLPDGSLRPGTRVTIPAGEQRELVFRPEGVKFLSGRARIVSIGSPLIDPSGQEIIEIVIDADTSLGIPWIHDEKPFRLRIHSITDFTLEARESWEGDPEKDLPKPHSL